MFFNQSKKSKKLKQLKKSIIMKKSIIYLGMALVAFVDVSLASNENTLGIQKITCTNYVTTTPLCLAISKGDIELTKKFIEYGADVNEKSNGMTPLMYAARYNKVEIMKILLKNGANPKTKDNQGFNALEHAKLSNAIEAITFLKSINENEKKSKDSNFKSIKINAVIQKTYISNVEPMIANPELILFTCSNKTFEGIIAENDKIIEETDTDEAYPLDFKIIESKSVFFKDIKATELVSMN